MNQNLKNIIIFVSGVAAGGVATWMGVKTYYEAKADLEVESVREAYNKKVASLEPEVSSIDGELEGPEEIEEEDIKQGRTKSSIVRDLNNKPPLTDYTKYFKKKDDEKTLDLKEVVRDAKEDAEEVVTPPDDKPYTDEEDDAEQLAYEDHKLNGAHKEAGPAHVIDKSDYELTCENYDKLSLLYYITDDLLTNEEGEIIGWSDVIGEEIEWAMNDTKFAENSDDMLHVRSDKLMCDFEIQKIFEPNGGNEE